MNILAIDTALGACSVAVLDGARVRARRHEEMARGHAEALAPMAEAAMREAGIAFAEIDRLGVTTGPGTFTGQRVGLAFARGLALALKKPAIGITTLDAMADESLAEGRYVLAIVAADAKRGEVYLGARHRARGGIWAPLLSDIDDAAERILLLAAETRNPASDIVLAGTAAHMLQPVLRAKGLALRTNGLLQPDAVAVARLAADATPEDAPPHPLYLRAPDARLPGAKLPRAPL